MDMPTDTSIFLETAGASAGVNYIIEYLRKWKSFSWLPETNVRRVMILKIASAGILAIGIHYRWDEVSRTVTLTIPTVAAMAHDLWAWFIQWAWMEISQRVSAGPITKAEAIKVEVI